MLSWTESGRLILWNINGGKSIQYNRIPWTENVPYPSSLESFKQIANAHSFNDVWTESAGHFISLANCQKGWIAHWHRDSNNKTIIAGVSGSSYVLSSGK